MMEDSHTPAGYIIAIAAVLGSALVMPPFPIFILSVVPLCVLGLVLFILVRKLRTRRKHLVPAQRIETYPVGKEKAA